jgi:hypothetical protein
MGNGKNMSNKRMPSGKLGKIIDDLIGKHQYMTLIGILGLKRVRLKRRNEDTVPLGYSILPVVDVHVENSICNKNDLHGNVNMRYTFHVYMLCGEK